METGVTLRPVTEDDLPVLYAHQRDPVAIRMAVFASREWGAFEEHWTKILADETVRARAVERGGCVVGHVTVFGPPGERLVGYWIDRDHWGRGIATAALALFLEEVDERPLHAHVATTNLGSIRVLEKCGFVVSGSCRVPVPDGEPAVDDWIMTLGA